VGLRRRVDFSLPRLQVKRRWRPQLTSIHHTASIPEPQRAAWLKNQVTGFKDKDEFEKEVVRHVETTLARSVFNCDETAAYAAASLAFRDRLVMEWNKTQQRQTLVDSKRVYYLSLEFLMGRALDNAMLNIGLKDIAKSEYQRQKMLFQSAKCIVSSRPGRTRIPH
jgi:hypothetical protein